MQVKINTNAKEIAKRVGKKGKELSASVKRALLITAQQGVNIIQDRTLKGAGIDKEFEPYSSRYLEAKKKGWPRTESRPAFSGDASGIVNLNVTGKMLGSMSVRANGKKAEIFFSRATESKKAAMNDKKRPFFGFSDQEEKQLGKIFFKALK